MIAAGIAANAHLTIKVTILQNDISKSITVTFCICSIFSLSFEIEIMIRSTVAPMLSKRLSGSTKGTQPEDRIPNDFARVPKRGLEHHNLYPPEFAREIAHRFMCVPILCTRH